MRSSSIPEVLDKKKMGINKNEREKIDRDMKIQYRPTPQSHPHPSDLHRHKKSKSYIHTKNNFLKSLEQSIQKIEHNRRRKRAKLRKKPSKQSWRAGNLAKASKSQDFQRALVDMRKDKFRKKRSISSMKWIAELKQSYRNRKTVYKSLQLKL